MANVVNGDALSQLIQIKAKDLKIDPPKLCGKGQQDLANLLLAWSNAERRADLYVGALQQVIDWAKEAQHEEAQAVLAAALLNARTLFDLSTPGAV